MSRVKTALLFAAVLFQLGLLKLHSVRADEDSPKSEAETDQATDDETSKMTHDETELAADTAEDKKDESSDDKKDDDEPIPDGDCPRPYFREYCKEDKPCCLYNKGSYTCEAVKEEGENCTQNAFGYNTRDCFCKQGFFCVDGICTSKAPPKQDEDM